nr:hypothetical protein [Gammaproteobacteria bacterium]
MSGFRSNYEEFRPPDGTPEKTVPRRGNRGTRSGRGDTHTMSQNSQFSNPESRDYDELHPPALTDKDRHDWDDWLADKPYDADLRSAKSRRRRGR